jgi:hypothetical protein
MKYFVYIYLMFIFAAYGQEHILIGDSQTYLLKKHSNIVTQVSKLCQSGIGVQDLIQKVKRYPIKTNVKSVTICIGVNDYYINKGIESLMVRVLNTFPNAKIFVVKGSWGWGKVRKVNIDKFNNYYKKFEILGAHLIKTPIGHGDPHRNKKVYKTIMSELENNLKNE